MIIWLVNTSSGFVCATDDDYEMKRNLQLGKVYACTVKDSRNYKFHKLYFSLIRCAWDLLPGVVQEELFHNEERGFRKAMEVTAGYYDLIYNIHRQEWMEAPKSIAYSELGEADFHTLYERVKDAVYDFLAKQGIDTDTIDNNLKNY